MNPEEIKEVLRLHGLHLAGDPAGKRANLRDANLEYANLEYANLEGANLRGANLEGASLRGVSLEGANLWDANLRGASLWGASLRGASLRDANLEGADLGDADLGDADLWGANLWGAILTGANLWGHKITRGPVVTYASRFWACSYPSESGRMLRYGCALHSLDYWEENLESLCRRHEPHRQARYVQELRLLLALCRHHGEQDNA